MFTCITAINIFTLLLVFSSDLGTKGQAGKRAVDRGYAADAIEDLEDAVVETPNNPVVYEYLAMAYLASTGGVGSVEKRGKAEAAMRKAIELGGRATIPVDLSLHDASAFFKVKNLSDFEAGKLHISKGRIQYVADPPRPGMGARRIPQFELGPGTLSRYGLSKSGASKGTFELADGKIKRVLRTTNFSPDEARILLGLIDHFVMGKD